MRFHRPCAELGSAQYTGDVDGDGYGDLLVRAGDSWRFARGAAGDVLVSSKSSLTARAGPGSILPVGDVDGDGFADVAFTGADRAVYWGGPDGLTEDRKLPLDRLAALSAARLDGTSPDLLAIEGDLPLDLSEGRSRLVDLTLAGRSGAHPGVPVSVSPAMSGAVAFVAGDFLGTGEACWLLGRAAVGPTTRLAWAGCASAGAMPSAPFGPLVEDGSLRLHLAATDANGDGIQDVYLSAVGARGEALLLSGGGGPAWQAPPVGCPHDAESCGQVLPLGDVDGDGLGDALFTWHDGATNDDHLTFLPGKAGRLDLDAHLTWALPRDGQ